MLLPYYHADYLWGMRDLGGRMKGPIAIFSTDARNILRNSTTRLVMKSTLNTTRATDNEEIGIRQLPMTKNQFVVQYWLITKTELTFQRWKKSMNWLKISDFCVQVNRYQTYDEKRTNSPAKNKYRFFYNVPLTFREDEYPLLLHVPVIDFREKPGTSDFPVALFQM